MASPADIATVREYTNEQTSDAYTDQRIGELIDANDNDLRKTASAIWSSKAASYAELVDVQEGSSRRSLGDLYEQALGMSKYWAATTDSGETPTTTRSSRMRPIERP